MTEQHWAPENLCANPACGHPRDAHLGEAPLKGLPKEDDSGWCTKPAGTCIFGSCKCATFVEPAAQEPAAATRLTFLVEESDDPEITCLFCADAACDAAVKTVGTNRFGQKSTRWHGVHRRCLPQTSIEKREETNVSDKTDDHAAWCGTGVPNAAARGSAGEQSGEGYTAEAAVRRLLQQLPPGTPLDISEEEMVRTLKGVMGEGKLIPLGDAARHFPSPEELVARGRGEMTFREAANLLGVDKPTIIQLMRAGTLRARTVSERRTFIEAGSVRAYLESQGKAVPKADDSVALLMSALRKMQGITTLESVLYAGCVMCGNSDRPATHVIEGYGNVCYRHAEGDSRAKPEPWAEEITALHKRGLRHENA